MNVSKKRLKKQHVRLPDSQPWIALSGPPWKVRSCSSPSMPSLPTCTGPLCSDLSIPDSILSPLYFFNFPERTSRIQSLVKGA
jgi:hypothetical protein